MDGLQLRPATSVDYDFLYALHRTTLKAYVDQIWRWNEQWQQDNFRDKFETSDRQVIVFRGEDIGVISVKETTSKIILTNIGINPNYQRNGIGTYLIRQVLDRAFGKGLPVQLQVLQGNPARQLYERLGFVVIEEKTTHCVMLAEPKREKFG